MRFDGYRLCVIRDTVAGLIAKGEAKLLERETRNQLRVFQNVLIVSLSDASSSLSMSSSLNHVNYIGLGDQRFPKVFGLLNITYRLIKALRIAKNFRPHMIRAYGLTEGFYACLIAKVIHVSSTISIHSDPLMNLRLHSPKSPVLVFLAAIFTRAAEKIVSKFASLILVVNKGIAQHFLAIGAPKDRVSLIRRPVDLNMFTPASSNYSLSDNIIYVGRLSREKNVEALIKAMPIVIKNKPNAQLLIVGDGPLRAELESLSHEIGVASNVCFMGFVPQEQIPKLFSRAAIFVLPSLTEGNPKALIEAMAAGMAVVASDIPSIKEVVSNGREATLVKPVHVEIAKAVIGLLNNKSKLKELGSSARQVALKFSMESVFDEELEVYRRLLGVS